MTAEYAIALPVMVMLWVFCLFSIVALTAQVRCVDAARELARAAARGEPPATLGRLADRLGPPGATWTTTRDGDFVVASVRLRLRAPGDIAVMDVLSATAVALRERDGLPAVVARAAL